MKKIILFYSFLLAFPVLFAQNGIDIDGDNDRINCGNDATVGITGTSLTLEAWIKPRAWRAEVWRGGIIVKEDDDVNHGYMIRCGDDGKLNVNIGSGAWNELTTDAGTLVLGEWQHVAATYDGAKLRLYVNGIPVDSSNVTVDIAGTDNNLVIGNWHYPDVDRAFDGSIDEVRIWNIVRSKAEINAMMNNEFCVIPEGLMAYYKLNEGVAGADNAGVVIAEDASGNGNDGDLSFFDLTGESSNWVDGAGIGGPAIASIISVSTCEDEYSVPSGDESYADVGRYVVTDTLASEEGCDSILFIHLTKGAETTSTVERERCTSYTVPSGDETYTDIGTYDVLDTLVNTFGCDSVITINLTIFGPSYSEFSVEECGSYSVPSRDVTYTEVGSYVVNDTIRNFRGCDSILIINLTILPISSSTITIETCNTYVVPSGDEIYTELGEYTIEDIIPNHVGCDSVITINLTLFEQDVTVNQDGTILTANAEDVSYQWVTCPDFDIIIDANDREFIADENGSYAVIITNGDCRDTSDCMSVVNAGIDKNTLVNSFNLYPNPTKGQFIIERTQNLNGVLLNVTDVNGRKVLVNVETTSNQFIVDLDAPVGVYFVNIVSDRETAVYRLVKVSE